MAKPVGGYASEYYDPVKAHQYYMKHRKLKGRQKGTSTEETNTSAGGINHSEKYLSMFGSGDASDSTDSDDASDDSSADSSDSSTSSGSTSKWTAEQKAQLKEIKARIKEQKTATANRAKEQMNSKISALREQVKRQIEASRKQKERQNETLESQQKHDLRMNDLEKERKLRNAKSDEEKLKIREEYAAKGETIRAEVQAKKNSNGDGYTASATSLRDSMKGQIATMRAAYKEFKEKNNAFYSERYKAEYSKLKAQADANAASTKKKSSKKKSSDDDDDVLNDGIKHSAKYLQLFGKKKKKS